MCCVSIQANGSLLLTGNVYNSDVSARCKQELCVYAISAYLGVGIGSHSAKILKF